MRAFEELVRENILKLAPYSSARNEYSGKTAHVFLDANENPYNKPFNRYPDPLQTDLKCEIAKIKHVRPDHIFLGNCRQVILAYTQHHLYLHTPYTFRK